ncbi:hypothetical protein NMY22_g13509 [Coprinellus aureogranulatus]|nr:hypothetical protein NMY22_g13509 [Coprinellus aureogranulatus]
MPAVRNDSAKDKRARARVPVSCPTCQKTVNRKADLTRHMAVHGKDETKKYICEYDECTYATRQKSNLTTHLRTHTGEKRFACTEDPASCSFRTSDPAAFTRHRKKKHGYIPQARSRKGSIATELALSNSPQAASQTPGSTSGTSAGTGSPPGDQPVHSGQEEEEPEIKGARRVGRRKSDEGQQKPDDDHPSPAPLRLGRRQRLELEFL